MTSHASSPNGVNEIRVEVTHGKDKMLLLFPAEKSTVGDVKKELMRRSGVPIEKQRLFFGAPVLKQYRREGREDVRLIDLISNHKTHDKNNNNNNNTHTDISPMAGSSPSPSTITIPLMLVGSVATIPHINEEAVAQLHRLVTTTVEQDNRWFRCSYSKGYARQTAFVCRTCVRSGRADAAHAICYACAEVCHRNHDVEEWGVRYYMRCDCCTAACWRPVAEEEKKKKTMMISNSSNSNSNDTHHHHHDKEVEEKEGSISKEKNEEEQDPGNNDNSNNSNSNNHNNDNDEPQRCCFIIDSETGLPPVTSVVPHNSKNRYPRDLYRWCYCNCEDDHPADDAEGGGIVCMLCSTCYWSAHMTRLCTEAFRRIPCYGDVVEGDVLAFHCRTCETLVCCPCRLRCHKDHDVSAEAVLASRLSGTHNEAPAGVEFSCGCRGCCDIAERVPPGDVWNDRKYSQMSAATATAMMNGDAFVGFVCGRCMNEHPWLINEDPRRCYAGKLPTSFSSSSSSLSISRSRENGKEGKESQQQEQQQQYRSIVPCGLSPDAPCADDVYPFHGMLFPVDAFTESATCTCGPCREAYSRFAPRSHIAAGPEMMVQLHDACDHCGHTIRDEQAFMCQTCELQHDQTFFVCQRCNRLRLQAQMPELGNTNSNPNTNTITTTTTTTTTTTSNNNNNNENNNTTTTTTAEEENSENVEVAPWDHPLSHVFVEDTYENLYTLCGMQMMQNLDSASRAYVMDNIDATTASFEGILRRTFGQEPLEFDLGEVAQHQQQLRLESEKMKREESGTADTTQSRKHQRNDDDDNDDSNNKKKNNGSDDDVGGGGTEGSSEKRKKGE
ncbi:uncharacterized protein TM35_000121580 [Trypanosoma theileri]|uniref:Ubiquitin-like domain-containing protein n=1 Tax=Trypanosoma theileri TaxID=67003 RepID=A0A1X0NY22_9TRYP|nr:uncharacterized protein TM35_000121580 [Trypanosoma theileri]ORC89383.1 hypothetical protein TM35_000121580 [Trypanosoma theileri]